MPAALPALLRRFSGPKQRRRSLYETSRGEFLENRIMPAAVAAASGSTLNINASGDVDGHDLQIEQVSGGVKVTALNGGTIRVGSSDVTEFTFSGVTSLNVKLGAGDDTVSLVGAMNLKNVSINLGDGDNILDIGTSVGASLNATGKVTVVGGTGNDLVTLNGAVAKSLNINTSIGNDEITLLGTEVKTTSVINTGIGHDEVRIDAGLDLSSASVDAKFGNSLTITTGEDDDTVSITSAVTKKVTINTGDDNDVVSLDDVTINGLINVDTSAGVDVLSILNVNQTAKGTVNFRLGTGADTVNLSASSSQFTTFTANVNLDLGTGINNVVNVDNTSFLGMVNLTARGTGDIINVEQDVSLAGATSFARAVKVNLGADADVNVSVLGDVDTQTNFLSTLAISALRPEAQLNYVVAGTTFASTPSLSRVIENPLSI
jgi:hypothetical protein